MPLLPAEWTRSWDRLRRTLAPEAHPALAGLDGELPPAEPPLACVFCGTHRHVIPHRGKGICVECVAEIRRLVSPGRDG